VPPGPPSFLRVLYDGGRGRGWRVRPEAVATCGARAGAPAGATCAGGSRRAAVASIWWKRHGSEKWVRKRIRLSRGLR
jgi:hypothetical protein